MTGLPQKTDFVHFTPNCASGTKLPCTPERSLKTFTWDSSLTLPHGRELMKRYKFTFIPAESLHRQHLHNRQNPVVSVRPLSLQL